MRTPLISVVIPTYNAEAHIQETVRSVLSQDETDFELLIVDDASTDNTLKLVRAMRDPRIRIIAGKDNLGRVGNVNRSFDLAKGKYIARLDHDDLAMPDRLSKQAQVLESQADITVVGSQIAHFGMDNTVSDFPLDDARIKSRFIMGAAYLANPSAMFRSDFVQQHHLRFDPNLYIVDDLGFWFECALQGARFVNLPQVLTAYRIHGAMTSRNLDFSRLYQAKVRLYSRLLPRFFPALTGNDVQALLTLYEEPAPSLDAQTLTRIHKAAGVALSQVDEQLGLHSDDAKHWIVYKLNQLRGNLVSSGQMHADQFAPYDQVFYAGQQNLLLA
jgi:glycosyltransferase involved in cell wall biosynthesis